MNFHDGLGPSANKLQQPQQHGRDERQAHADRPTVLQDSDSSERARQQQQQASQPAPTVRQQQSPSSQPHQQQQQPPAGSIQLKSFTIGKPAAPKPQGKVRTGWQNQVVKDSLAKHDSSHSKHSGFDRRLGQSASSNSSPASLSPEALRSSSQKHQGPNRAVDRLSPQPSTSKLPSDAPTSGHKHTALMDPDEKDYIPNDPDAEALYGPSSSRARAPEQSKQLHIVGRAHAAAQEKATDHLPHLSQEQSEASPRLYDSDSQQDHPASSQQERPTYEQRRRPPQSQNHPSAASDDNSVLPDTSMSNIAYAAESSPSLQDSTGPARDNSVGPPKRSWSSDIRSSSSTKRLKLDPESSSSEFIPGLGQFAPEAEGHWGTQRPLQHRQAGPSDGPAHPHDRAPLPLGPKPPLPPPPSTRASLSMPPIKSLAPPRQTKSQRYLPPSDAHVAPQFGIQDDFTQTFLNNIPSEPSESPPHALIGTSDFKSTYQKQEQLGEGTFGVVWRGTTIRSFGPTQRPHTWREQVGLTDLKVTSQGQVKRHHVNAGTVVALKQILLHQEFEGMPITSLREIKILKMLDHPNCVPLLDMASEQGDKDSSDKNKRSLTYMVFPYMEHDLAGLLSAYKLPEREIKLFTMQLLQGTHYLHSNHILHRDMKSANLLVDQTGLLKIADFGLARPLDPKGPRKYTGTVVTRWYRPPELLLGDRFYSYAVDIWGIGCIVAEMFVQRPYMPGSSDLDQAQRIFAIFGRPWDYKFYRDYDAINLERHKRHNPNSQDPPPLGVEGVSVASFSGAKRTIKEFTRFVPKHQDVFVDFMTKLMCIDPTQRISAAEALDHDWFWTAPAPAKVGEKREWNPSKEMDRKRERDNHVRKEQMRTMPVQPHHHKLPPQASASRAPGHQPPGYPPRPGYGGAGGGGQRPPPSGFVKGGPAGGPSAPGYGSSGVRRNRAPPPMVRK